MTWDGAVEMAQQSSTMCCIRACTRCQPLPQAPQHVPSQLLARTNRSAQAHLTLLLTHLRVGARVAARRHRLHNEPCIFALVRHSCASAGPCPPISALEKQVSVQLDKLRRLWRYVRFETQGWRMDSFNSHVRPWSRALQKILSQFVRIRAFSMAWRAAAVVRAPLKPRATSPRAARLAAVRTHGHRFPWPRKSVTQVPLQYTRCRVSLTLCVCDPSARLLARPRGTTAAGGSLVSSRAFARLRVAKRPDARGRRVGIVVVHKSA